MDIYKQLLLQLILILLNAFFAATEIAVISLNEKKVKAKANTGDKKAKKMLKMIEEPTGFLSTIQIGITLAGFLGSAFAADNFANRLSSYLITAFHIPEAHIGAINTTSVIVITLILSFFTLVLGELVPKRVAMKHKEKLAEYVCGIISFMAVALKPIIWLLTISTNGILRLFHIDPNEKDEPVSEEDIVIMLDAGGDEGTLDKDDISYIKNVFKLDKMTAKDVMTHRKNTIYITEDASEDEIYDLISKEGYSRIPVFNKDIDVVVGILYSKDYLLNYKKEDFVLEQVIADTFYVPETMKLDVLIKTMQHNHTHIAVVLNEYGFSQGIVTLEDILEEIVGEIWDESDEEISTISEQTDGTYQVLCRTATDDFFDFFELPPDETCHALTINGWLIEKCGSIPKSGYTFDYENISITVTKADSIMANEISVSRSLA